MIPMRICSISIGPPCPSESTMRKRHLELKAMKSLGEKLAQSTSLARK
jgi:hypothetical protein